MNDYLNPGNGSFQEHLDRKIYVDKTGLIKYTNECITYKDKFLCVSRPRRFGKSHAADMLTAYYGRGCDSHTQFNGLEISKDDTYEEYINKYNVVHCIMTQLLSNGMRIEEGLADFKANLIDELTSIYPDITFNGNNLIKMFKAVYDKTMVQFVFIFDEWDCVFRERKEDTEGQKSYLDFLRDLLKDQQYVALAYMTGILPIRKYGTHSALNMFKEISMTGADPVQEYMGFTEDEVKKLCDEHGKSFKGIKSWYNGYTIDGVAIYNPYAVYNAVLSNLPPKGYWTATETYEALNVYIRTNTYGVQDVLSELLEGKSVKVDIGSFSNDMVTFESRDDVLTLLIHLGYLSYNSKTKKVKIPNREIKEQFKISLKNIGLGAYDEIKLQSEAILEATLKGDAETVAKRVQRVHRMRSSKLEYNKELSLKTAIQFAYIAAENHYNAFLELSAGDGFADVGYVPINSKNPNYPPMIVELKVDKSAEGAIEQALDKEYFDFLHSYHGDVVVVGINYDEDTKQHTCEIKRVKV
ncbi:MAG: AAA family ATPase [Clostridia bacterium]|nr:AAA family ATPase [Clostridia bacterium]